MSNKFVTTIKKVREFLENDIWSLNPNDNPYIKRTFYSFIKVLIVAYQGIKEDNVQVRASALTFFTLLSIVPVLAMAFGLAKGFGLDAELERQIMENFSGQQEILEQSLTFAQRMLNNTKGGLIAGIGLLFLFYSVMKLLNNIETSFNDIWYVTKQRSFARKLTDYITMMLLGPILMVMANSLTIFISNQIEYLTETVSLLGLFKSVIFPLLRLLPFVVIWLLFTMLYIIMPNTTVKFKPAFIGGVVAGSAFQLLQWGLIRFEVNMSQYNAIYGSFAALPLFLIWLQFSWLIVLYGSEISYAVQNVSNFESIKNAEGFSQSFKKKIALATSSLIIHNFKTGEHALTFTKINAVVKVPNKLLHEVINTLIEGNVLSELKLEDESAYQPAVDTDLLTIQYILLAYDDVGEALKSDGQLMTSYSGLLNEINTEMTKSKHNRLMKDI